MSLSHYRSWTILPFIGWGAFYSIFLLTTPAQAIVDTNENGVSDLWEKHYNNDALFTDFDPQADPDGDGWSNEVEAISGTDPFDGNLPTGCVRPAIEHFPAVYGTDGNGDPEILTPETVTITWPTVVGKQYTLLTSLNLSAGSWIPVDNNTPRIGTGEDMGNGIPLTQPDGSTPESLFLRVAVEDVDSDGDNLTDAEEHQFGSNPGQGDTDQDGVNDFDENLLGTNPTVPRIWAFKEMPNADGTVTFSWNSYASNGDWFKIETEQLDGSWQTIYSTTYGSENLPFVEGAHSYSLTLNPDNDYAP